MLFVVGVLAVPAAHAQPVPQMTGQWSAETTIEGDNDADKRRVPQGAVLACVQSQENVICQTMHAGGLAGVASEHTWSGTVTPDGVALHTIEMISEGTKSSNWCLFGQCNSSPRTYELIMQLTGTFTNPTMIEGKWKGELVVGSIHYPVHGTWRAIRTDTPAPQAVNP
jgi:hypothetical protein